MKRLSDHYYLVQYLSIGWTRIIDYLLLKKRLLSLGVGNIKRSQQEQKIQSRKKYILFHVL